MNRIRIVVMTHACSYVFEAHFDVAMPFGIARRVEARRFVWAYEVHKSSHGALILGTLGARGQQSIAEAGAKHLREYIEKGR